MASLCDDVELFVDGELAPERAEAFRNHLPDCARCQREVSNLVQLALLQQRHFEQLQAQAPTEPPRLAPAARWKPHALLVAASLLGLVLAVVMLRPEAPPAPQADVWLARLPQRPLEARLSHPEADHHRPPPSRMMGGGGFIEDLPLQEMAALKETDPLGLAALWLLHQEPNKAEKVLQKLDAQGPSPDVDNARAVVALLRERPAEALGHTARALEQTPRHPQALWNRALALERLHLPLLAARTFEEVASLREPGWAEEASQKAERLRGAVSERQKHWEHVHRSGSELLVAGPGSLPEGFSRTPIARHLFYEAVRAASSRERVLALLPLAQHLDAWAGGQVLERYVHRVAQQHLPGPQSAPLREDPWFQLLAAEERARAEQQAGHWEQALQTLRGALEHCPARRLEYRCLTLLRDLSGVHLQRREYDAAREHAESGLRQARDSGEWRLETGLLWQLAQLARFINDAPLARARYQELLERHPDDVDMVRRVHQHLADIEWHELRVDAARRELDAALATGQPLSLSGAYTLADVARLQSSPADTQHLTSALRAVEPRLTRGERAQATHVLGRFFIERDPARGQALLWRAIDEAQALGLREDPVAREARTYSFTSLLMHAGQQGDFPQALKLLERERGQPLPGHCLLAASVDSERTLLLVRGASGELTGRYEDTRRRPLPPKLKGLVPASLLEPLRPCTKVDVLARPPLHGRAGLLPPELAWSYLTRTSTPPAPPAGPQVHLVVSDVELPPDAGFERLQPWTPSFGTQERQVLLKGTRATPSSVLAQMSEAHEIDLVTHGVINDSTTTSHLLLAPEPGGSKLDMQRVRETPLRGAPFVTLVACHAAHTSYALHEPLSLPAAFIEAGARGVLAATEKIPDQEANAFFNAIRERMRAGTPPAQALRDERMQWLRADRKVAGLDSILLFE